MDPEGSFRPHRYQILFFLSMAPRIVSWSDNEICKSPVMWSAASIVSFDSTLSDAYKPPTTSKPPEFYSTDLGTRHTTFPAFSEGGETARGGHETPDDSFVRHDAYFFKDGNVTFLIGGTLYCVHRYFFSRDSVYFSARFAQLGIRDHETLRTIISIGDVERSDFEAFLSVLYPTSFEAHELTYEQWKSVLHLSTRWGFASLRKLVLKSIKPPTPHDQLVLARTYSINQWALPALAALCERISPLSLDEARQMNMEDVILVATVREEIRGRSLRVDPADIPRHVAQVGKLNCLINIDVYSDGPKSRTTGQESNSTMASVTDPNVKVDGAQMIEVASPPSHKFPDSVLVSSKVGSTQAQETTLTEVATDYTPSKNPAPSPAASPGPTPVSLVSEKKTTPEPAASASAGPESPAATKASPAAPQDSVKPDGAVTEPTFRLSQHSEAGGWGSAVTKGCDANPAGPVKPTLSDHVCEVSTSPAMSVSGPRLPEYDPAPSSLEEVYSEASGYKPSKSQKRKLREKAKRALMDEKRSPPPPSGETSISVGNSAVQETKHAATVAVDIPVGKGEGVRVDAKTESDKDEARVTVEKPDVAATTAEKAADALMTADRWGW